MGTVCLALMFEDVRTTVVGYHTPNEAPSENSPGQPEGFEVIEVYAFGVAKNMADFLGEDRCKDIAQAILNREGIIE